MERYSLLRRKVPNGKEVGAVKNEAVKGHYDAGRQMS